VTPSAAITTGNRLVVLVGVWNNSGPTANSVTDSAGNTYVKLTQFKARDWLVGAVADVMRRAATSRALPSAGDGRMAATRHPTSLTQNRLG